MRNRTYANDGTHGPPVPMRSLLAVDDRLVLGTMIAADGKPFLADFRRNPVIRDGDKILQPVCRAGFRIPIVDQGPSLPLRDQNSDAFQFIELLLDRIQGHSKIGGDGTSVGVTMMKQVEKHRQANIFWQPSYLLGA